MGKAPSEKHLEDYLWTHPEAFGEENWNGENALPHIVPLWRQVHMVSGIVDMVASNFDCGLAVIEIKKGKIDTKAFAQLMRYMRDFKNFVNYALCRANEEDPRLGNLSIYDLNIHEWRDLLLRGILVGEAIEDHNLLVACRACDVAVYTYNFDHGDYILTEILESPSDEKYPGDTLQTPLQMWRFLCNVIRNMIADQLESRNFTPKFNAIDAAQNYLDSIEDES